MKEDITLVLNEREPEKARLAELLEEQLQSRGLSVGRIELTDNLIKRLLIREPKVIVTDYVLGDVTTGLDLLSAVSMKRVRSQVIFFTDEPSAAVALKALKNGAVDYFLMNSADNIKQVVERIAGLLAEGDASSKAEPAIPNTIGHIIAESMAARRWRGEIEAAASESAQITVLQGRPGSGRRLSAEIVHSLRGHLARLDEIDWRYLDANLSFELGFREYCCLTNVDEASEELLKELIAIPWSQCQGRRLYITTFDSQLFESISRIVPTAKLINVPKLADRGDDISGVLKIELKGLSKAGSNLVSPKTVTHLSEMEWPGEMRQLISLVKSAVFLTKDSDDGDILAAIEELLASSKDSISRSAPSRLRALATLHSLGSYRLASINLGCSVWQLKELIQGDNV